MFRLLDLVFPPRADERVLRTVSTDDFLACMAPRLVPETRPGTVSLFSYADPIVRSAIHEAKYHGNAHAFSLLALALADYLREMFADRMHTERMIVVPIPLGRARFKERGYNQAEEIARRAIRNLSAENGIALESNLLVRTRETVSQVSLERRKREENMRGAFRAARDRIDPTRTYLVIDDVLTTGATLQAAVDALREAGAREIVPIALAH